MNEPAVVVQSGFRWDRLGPLIAALVLLAGGFGFYWMEFRESPADRCRRVATDQSIHDATRMTVDRTGQGVPAKPPSTKDRRWYDEHCYNGQPYRTP